MAVSAHLDKNYPESANHGLVDLRGPSRVAAGSYVYDGDRIVTGWHHHDLHQLEYSVHGVLGVETAHAHYLLPPQQAAWIPAGIAHVTTTSTAARTISVFIEPHLMNDAGERAQIVAVDPVLREMLTRSLRWPIDRVRSDAVADRHYGTLVDIIREVLDHESPLSLPTSTHPIVAAAMAYTREHLAEVTAATVSRAIGVSERTLRRHFDVEVHQSWRSYLQQARLLRAMALLAGGTDSVLDIAGAVGFESASAFNRAFLRHCGLTPSTYRRHATARVA